MINPFLFLFRARDKPRDAVSAATTFSFGREAFPVFTSILQNT